MATPSHASQPATLFERLGGVPAIKAAVDAFYARVLGDDTLAPFFAGVSLRSLVSRQNAFFIQALGGPQVYKGKDMRTAHAHLPIRSEHFGAVAGHLAAALGEVGVPPALVDEVIAAVAPLAAESTRRRPMRPATTPGPARPTWRSRAPRRRARCPLPARPAPTRWRSTPQRPLN
jgi:hemoglobin